MRVGYLTNVYPKTSHSFIRREILGVEASGIEVVRYSVRATSEPLVDPADRLEAERTRVLLTRGALTLVQELLQLALSPARFVRGLVAASRLARGSQRGFLYHLAYLAEAGKLARWARQDGVTHLHAHFGTNATSVATLCEALGGPGFSFTVHSPLSSEVPELCALTQKVHDARFVCAVSQHGKSQLMRWSGAEEWSRIHLVRCGTEAQEGPRATGERNSRRLVCIARMSPEKGHGVLLRAMQQLLETGVEFELDLVGDGPLRASLETLATELGIHPHVHFHGWKSGAEVRQFLARARALVLPSFVEGLPVVIMEALAQECPVIATWVGGVPELVVPGRTGWLLSPGSPEALAEACREALSTPAEELQAMGRLGASVVSERHDSRIESARLAELFHNHTTSEAA